MKEFKSTGAFKKVREDEAMRQLKALDFAIHEAEGAGLEGTSRLLQVLRAELLSIVQRSHGRRHAPLVLTCVPHGEQFQRKLH